MKNWILLVFAFLFSACEDKETSCYICTVSEAGQQTQFTRCDITQREAANIERAGTVVDPNGLNFPGALELKKYTRCVPSD